MWRGWAVAGALGVALTPSFACGPIVGAPLSSAPANACGVGELSCDRYVVQGTSPKAQCRTDPQTKRARCDLGKPDFAYTIVVSVPESSYYASGRTFVLTNNDLVAPTGAPADRGGCSLSAAIPCKRLPPLVSIGGRYRTTIAAARDLGVDVKGVTSIPVRATFVPLAINADVEAFGAGIPVQDFVVASTRSVLRPEVSISEAVAIGRYQRIAYPEPPFDAYFPPVFTRLVIGDSLDDDINLGMDNGVALDDSQGTTRESTITRLEGLDGWHAWLADEPGYGGRRISTIKTLSGSTSTVKLHTIGASQAPSTALRAHTQIVIAPPAGWLGVPRLESAIFNGDPAGFKSLSIPLLKTPVVVSGVIGQGDDTTLTGIPSRLVFTSTVITTASGDPAPTLKYETSVSTDDSGRFQTVLPQGSYEVIVEPAEGTGLSKYKDTLATALTVAKTFRPPGRTRASGRAVLSDGRPLPEATVLAVPAEVALVGRAVKPRPARTRTLADGTFSFEVDQGQYTLMVEPLAGTDFPRVVQARSFTGVTSALGDVVVDPPLRVAFTLKDPSDTVNPISRANVSIYAEIPGRGPPAVEMGRATTDSTGYVEILLAPRAR